MKYCWLVHVTALIRDTQWRTEGGDLGCSNLPPEIPKALHNRAKINSIVKAVKNC